MTNKNGTGIREFLDELHTQVRGVTVIDKVPRFNRQRQKWLRGCLGNDVRILYHSITAQQAVRNMPAGEVPADFRARMENMHPPVTNDLNMTNLYTRIMQQNKWSPPKRRRKRASSCASSSSSSREFEHNGVRRSRRLVLQLGGRKIASLGELQQLPMK